MAGKISLTLNYDDDLDSVLSRRFPDWEDYRVLSKSLDARGANRGKGPKYHYSLHFIKKGEKFTELNLAVKRPGSGISPMKLFQIVGKIAKKNFVQDELIKI